MNVWDDARVELLRITAAGIRFLASLTLAALLVASGIGLETLINFTLEKGSKSQELVSVVLDVSLIGAAIVVSACGACLVAGESVRSTRDFFTRRRDREE